MSKKTIEELEKDNEDLVKILTRRKDAGATASITELTAKLANVRQELTQERTKNEQLRAQKQNLQELLQVSEDAAEDLRDALNKLVGTK